MRDLVTRGLCGWWNFRSHRTGTVIRNLGYLGRAGDATLRSGSSEHWVDSAVGRATYAEADTVNGIYEAPAGIIPLPECTFVWTSDTPTVGGRRQELEQLGTGLNVYHWNNDTTVLLGGTTILSLADYTKNVNVAAVGWRLTGLTYVAYYWMNGRLMGTGSGTLSSTPDPSSGVLRLGWGTSWIDPWMGCAKYTDFKMYDRCLSTPEVAALAADPLDLGMQRTFLRNAPTVYAPAAPTREIIV